MLAEAPLPVTAMSPRFQPPLSIWTFSSLAPPPLGPGRLSPPSIQVPLFPAKVSYLSTVFAGNSSSFIPSFSLRCFLCYQLNGAT